MKWSHRVAWIVGVYLCLMLLRGALLQAGFAFVSLPLRLLSFLVAPAVELLQYPSIRAESAVARQRLADATRQVIVTQQLQAENEHLKQLLGLREQTTSHRFVAAKVLARDPTHWTRAVLINKGQRHGLEVGAPVVGTEGVVGKILEVYAASSVVLLITDPEVRIGATVSRTREQGIAQGDGRWRMRLNYLAMDAEVAMGDLVISSGVGGVFPSGLPLGYVESAAEDPSRLYRVAILRPAAALSRLEDVGCLVQHVTNEP